MNILTWIVILWVTAKLRRATEKKPESEWTVMFKAARKYRNKALMFEEIKREWVPQPIGVGKPKDIREN